MNSDFIWGVSSSALQTEGAFNVDEKGLSIWDVFDKRKILNKDQAHIATNFYYQYEEDIKIIKQLGIKHFRFSISWARILPEGIGKINYKGIEFYEKVIKCCIENEIEPWITLYHWDLPLELEKKGGWANRSIIEWFSEYVNLVVNHFHKYVKNWMVLNEPMVFTGAGYYLGIHAPGRKKLSNFLPALHHAALCIGIGSKIIRKIQPHAHIGSTFSCSHITSYTNKEKDIRAARRIDILLNNLFIDLGLGKGYPFEELPFLKKIKKYIHSEDIDTMKADLDFIGIQTYTREVIKYHPFIPYLKAKPIPAHKRKVNRTLCNWEIFPDTIFQMVKKFSEYLDIKSIIITENGASFPDIVIDHQVNDHYRIKFLHDYIQKTMEAKTAFPKLKGYFVWSLTDNFEWAEGYSQRFGLVHIDYNTQKRTIKNSAYWYRDFIKLQENKTKQ